MFSKKYTERHWEIVRDYLARSYFEDVPMPSFSTTSEEEDTSSRFTSSADLSPRSAITLPRISPLPELIIERVNRDNRHDEPEEFYDKLEAKIKKIMNRIQEASQSDDVNALDTIILMDISQDSVTAVENFDASPNGHINDFSIKTEINDSHSEPQISHLNENEVQTEDNRNDDTSEPDLSQKTDDNYEESITYTLEDNKKPIINKDYHYNSIPNERNFVSKPHEVLNESVSVETIANVHSVPKKYTPSLLHTIGTVNVSKSPILGLPVNKKAENKNCLEYSTSAAALHESANSESMLEESSDINRLETIWEENESQFEGTSDSSRDDVEDGDVTSGSQSQHDSAPKTNSSLQTDPQNPEIMRATNKKSFRTTRFSFTAQDADNEIDIFAKPTITKKKHSEIQEEEDHAINLSHENDVVVNTNADFVTLTPKSRMFNYSVHEIGAASPEFVDKSQQTETQSSRINKRKRRANDSVNDAHSVTGEGDNPNWNSLKKNFFIGVPEIYNLCTCKNHSCA